MEIRKEKGEKGVTGTGKGEELGERKGLVNEGIGKEEKMGKEKRSKEG